MYKTRTCQENETGHADQSKQPRPVQILNKGLLNVSQFKVWDSLVVFSVVARSQEKSERNRLKKSSKPERDASESRNHASDLKDDRDAFVDRTGRYDEGKDD
jgi:hypothetical protein